MLMATLTTGLNTLEIGSTAWREIVNADLELLDVRTILSGTLAARPSTASTPRFYYATDSGQLFFDTGLAWRLLAGGATGVSNYTASFTLALADASGVTINAASLAITAQHGAVTLVKAVSDAWDLFGDL
jgi:hypothetical protein